MGVDRRRFLGFAAGAAGGAAAGVPLGRTVSDVMEALAEPVYPPRGPEDFVLSVCGMCEGGCGLRVRRIGGRPVKVDGNPLHPVNAGRLCPKGQAALQSLYHPDRIKQPLRRTGAAGSPDSFTVVEWDEALGALAERLALLRQVGRPESLALLRGGGGGLAERVGRRFLEAFGSPNDIVCSRGEEAAALATKFTQGVRRAPALDLAETDYVLSFGSSLLEASSSPVYTMRGYGAFRQGRPGRRGKMVQIESRLSITGSSADEWIAVRAGTEGVLALGVAQVLVSENLYDREFVGTRSKGFDAPFRGEEAESDLRSYLLRNFSLERVSAETGVASSVILRLAREFAAARRQLAVGPRKGPLLPGPLFDHLAVQTLNGVMGSIDRAGGLLLSEDEPLAAWPELPADEVREAGSRRPRLDRAGETGREHLVSDPAGLVDALTAGGPYPLEVLLVLDADPVFTSTAPEAVGQALERVPLVISFSSMLDDTALYADWILPQHHFLERHDLATAPPGVPFPSMSLGVPALDTPLNDTRAAADVFLSLAERLGEPLRTALPWPDSQRLIDWEIQGFYAARRGAVMGTSFDEAWVRMMERAGWWVPGYQSEAELRRRMGETGGWWDPFYDHGNWQRVLSTASGRFEFRVDLLAALDRARPVPRPEAETGTNGFRDGALALVLFEPLPVSGGVGAELPFLQEILDPGHEASWETWAELHPETASSLGISEGDRVRVASESGAVEARARLTRRAVLDAVAMPVGLGKAGGGRWAAGRGTNPLRLLSGNREAVSARAGLEQTRVRLSVVRRAGRHAAGGGH